MNYQHVENLLIRYRGGTAKIKTTSGEVYDGTIADVTNDMSLSESRMMMLMTRS